MGELKPTPGATQNGTAAPGVRAEVPGGEAKHDAVLRLVGNRKSVLQLGCGEGELTRRLREADCSLVAIESDSEAAKKAAAYCDEVILGNVEELDLLFELGDRRFQVVVAGQILTRLRDSSAVLSRLREWIEPGGYLILAVRNAAFVDVRVALLHGDFSADVLHSGSPHVFTRSSLNKLIADSGYLPVLFEATRADGQYQIRSNGLPPAVLEYVLRDEEALVERFVVVAFPLPYAQTSSIPRLVQRLAAERDRAMREFEGQRDELIRLRAELDRTTGDCEEARLRLYEARDEVLREAEEFDRLRAERAKHAAAIAQSERTITNYAAHIEVLRTRIQELEQALAGIYGSKMWRWSERYRNALRALGARR